MKVRASLTADVRYRVKAEVKVTSWISLTKWKGKIFPHEMNEMWQSFICFKCIYFLKSIYFNWSLITLQYCGGFCYTLTWISHGYTCFPHPKLFSLSPPHPIPLGCPSVPALSALFSCIILGLVICFTYGNIHVSVLFSQIIPPLPCLMESKSLFFTSVSLLLSHI